MKADPLKEGLVLSSIIRHHGLTKIVNQYITKTTNKYTLYSKVVLLFVAVTSTSDVHLDEFS